ncbi:ribonuclease catalytic domain-containing protein [Pelistega ratti]|uniref:ribonuclease catalytic domain-containing protein n=1 Tax=Pelistega ratti TaxID=2652177 RepID=UPI00135CC615|nr:ribonuclease catalytic domain-containing protein [Pelistega ratti]
MYVLFEESGQFKTGTILSEAETSLQVETASGKRSKIKRANLIWSFDDEDPHTLLDKAGVLAADIDINFLWEIAPTDAFNAIRLAKEYYGDHARTLEQTALLLCLYHHPIYFHRKGKGVFLAAPQEILQAALQAQEKKRQQAQQQQEWADAMLRGETPEALKEILPSFLNTPNKNTLEWKAFSQVLEQTGLSVAELLLKLRVFPHALAVHRASFFGQYFPKGIDNPTYPIPTPEPLPQATVKAFSIDDLSTTEIDDAFSIQPIDTENFIFGIHIACPALVIDRDSALDLAARQRMSTVYFPGDKIPMQEEALIKAFSLDEGKYCPTLSLYITANITTGEIQKEETRLEQVFIQANLRTNHLESLLTKETLENPTSDIPHGTLFKPMWAFAKHLLKAREEYRGKPEISDRVEYLFNLEGSPDDPDAKLILTPRMRNAPLDKMVAEFMILCNSRWAKYLDELGLPGIFRSQQNGRVRISTHCLPHEAIGVESYAWTTSPLRRYIDLFNQTQLIAAVKHGISARLVAPYKPKDPAIFSIINAFESKYTSYLDHQHKMERYWCLRYLEQNHIQRTTATVIRDTIIRFDHLPLTTSLLDLPELEKGTPIEIDILGIDLYQLTVSCRLVAIHSSPTEELS